MKKASNFRPYVPTKAYPRVAAMHGRDAHAHGAAGLANPLPRDLLFTPWEKLYAEPLVGITTDGSALPGLFTLAPNGAPGEAMVVATLRLIAGLAPEQRQALMFDIDAREWRRWNNTEMYVYKYGLRLEEVALPQRDAILEVMRASLSSRGFQKTRDVMRLNHFLGELAFNTRVLGEWSFNFTLFGTPSASQPWGWQLAGHHLVLNCFVLDGQMVLSPAFMGAEPNYADCGPFAGTRLFELEENGGLGLVRALAPAQRAEAILFPSNLAGDLPAGRRHRADQLHLGGAFQDNRIVPQEGVAAAGFSKRQRRHLLDLVEAFVEPLPDGPLRARMEEVERHLEGTRFCWIGGTGDDDTFYYRIHSPVLMIEFDHHSGVFLTNEAPAKFHIHTIVRTPNGNDYGADLLRQHHARDHHAGSQPGRHADQIGHKHSHAGGNEHEHPHDHGHAHDHGQGPAHSHDHGHEQPHDHANGHRHDHSHSHDHGHSHGHSHDDGHGHKHQD